MGYKLLQFVVVLSLASLCAGTCYDYWNGDVLPTYNNSTYCKSVIIWPVSDEVLTDSATRDSKALAYYIDVYNTTYLQGEVTTDCLGMIKYMACAVSYPTCDGSSTSIPSVCSWLCTLMAIRCGTTTQLYQDACVTGATSSIACSNQSHFFLGAFLFFTFLLIM